MLSALGFSTNLVFMKDMHPMVSEGLRAEAALRWGVAIGKASSDVG